MNELPDPRLVTRQELAKFLSLSCRSIDTLQSQKKIPCVKLSRRCVRFNVRDVLRALERFTVKEAK
jgi:hypothetical protein